MLQAINIKRASPFSKTSSIYVAWLSLSAWAGLIQFRGFQHSFERALSEHPETILSCHFMFDFRYGWMSWYHWWAVGRPKLVGEWVNGKSFSLISLQAIGIGRGPSRSVYGRSLDKWLGLLHKRCDDDENGDFCNNIIASTLIGNEHIWWHHILEIQKWCVRLNFMAGLCDQDDFWFDCWW